MPYDPNVFVVESLLQDVTTSRVGELSELISLDGSHARLLYNITYDSLNSIIGRTAGEDPTASLVCKDSGPSLFGDTPAYEVTHASTLRSVMVTVGQKIWDLEGAEGCHDDTYGLAAKQFVDEHARILIGASSAGVFITNAVQLKSDFVDAVLECAGKANGVFVSTGGTPDEQNARDVALGKLYDSILAQDSGRFAAGESDPVFVKGDEIVTSFVIRSPATVTLQGVSLCDIAFKVSVTIMVR